MRFPIIIALATIAANNTFKRFLDTDMDVFSEPVLVGLRALEQSALLFSEKIIPADILTKHKKLSKFHLFTPEAPRDGIRLHRDDKSGFAYYHPGRETKMIIHGFMDKATIAKWMHHMKDEFLLLDDFNVIIVDWSVGNMFPYTQAAANTERVGKEIAEFITFMMENYGAHPSKFHLLGHSLGSHVAGYVGERIRGLKRITGLDPATHLFSNSSPRAKLDREDADFVDVIHTDAGGIGIAETEGHVDFYPNGGEVQPGCTASNSFRSLFEKGVIEGVRNIICSHMRAPLLFTDTINGRHCEMMGHMCNSAEDFQSGKCDSCGLSGEKCSVLGYHTDTTRNYRNGTKFYLLTSKSAPYCGYEYKLSFHLLKEGDKTWRNILPRILRRRSGAQWTKSDTLHITLYGSRGSIVLELDGKDKQDIPAIRVVFSAIDLGVVHGAITHWSKKPLKRVKGVVSVISKVITGEVVNPLINKIQVQPMKNTYHGRNIPVAFDLCVNPTQTGENSQTGSVFRNEYC